MSNFRMFVTSELELRDGVRKCSNNFSAHGNKVQNELTIAMSLDEVPTIVISQSGNLIAC